MTFNLLQIRSFCFFILFIWLSALVPPLSHSAEPTEPQVIIKKVLVKGNDLVSKKQMAPALDLDEGLPMTPELIQQIIANINGYYAGDGYNLVSVSSSENDLHEGVLTVLIDETAEKKWGKPKAEKELAKLVKVGKVPNTEEAKSQALKEILQRLDKERILDGQRKVRILTPEEQEDPARLEKTESVKQSPPKSKPVSVVKKTIAVSPQRQPANVKRKPKWVSRKQLAEMRERLRIMLGRSPAKNEGKN